MTRRSLLIAALAAHAVLGTSSWARAESVEACVDASESAQALRDAGRLVAARERLMVCAQSACPPVVRKDCAEWLAELNVNVPTVVLSATDPSGRDLTDLRVSVDGGESIQAPAGRAVFLDPGAHRLRFEAPGTVPVEQQVIVRQGEKNRVVGAVLLPPRSPSSPPVASTPASTSRVPPSHAKHWDGRRTAGVIIGGAGVVAIAVGAYFGLRALAKRDASDDACPAGRCTAEGVARNDEAFVSAWVANIGLGLGVASVGVGAYLWLTSKVATVAPPSAWRSSVRIAPGAARAAAGMTLGGTF